MCAILTKKTEENITKMNHIASFSNTLLHRGFPKTPSNIKQHKKYSKHPLSWEIQYTPDLHVRLSHLTMIVSRKYVDKV